MGLDSSPMMLSGNMNGINAAYYGEVEFQVEYDYSKGEAFPWLFIDFENLAFYAEKYGFKAELIYEDNHYNYLGRIVRKME